MSAALFVMAALRRSWRRHPFRALAAAVGVMLGTALTGMVVNIDATVEQAVDAANPASLVRADVAVRSRSNAGFGYALGRRLRAAAGPARTLAVLQANAQLVEGDGRATDRIAVLGVSSEIRRFFPRGALHVLGRRRPDARAPGLVVSGSWLRTHGLRVGDRIALTTPRGDAAWTVMGALEHDLPSGAAIAVGEIDVVGYAFKRAHSIDALYMQLPRDASGAAAIRRLQAAARGVATVGPAHAASQGSLHALAIVRSLLVVAGAIGLLSAAIVVFVCWRLLLEDERTSLARLRLTGATPAQLATGAAILLFPATLACSLLGVPLGLLGARLLRGLSVQLVAYTGLAVVPSPADAVRTALAGIASGMVIAGIAWLAGIGAFVRVPALEAVRPPDLPPPPRGGRYLAAGATGLAALALAALAPMPPATSLASVALAALGSAGIAAGAGVLLGKALAVRGGFVSMAAGRHISGDARRTAVLVTMTGLSIAAGLTLGGVARSYRSAIERNVASWTQADLFVRLGRPGTTLRDARFPPSVRARLERLPGVAQAGAYTSVGVDFRGRTLLLEAYDPAHTRGIVQLIVYDGARGAALWRALERGKVAVSQSMARLDGLSVGDRLALPGAAGTRRVTVAAVVDDYVSDGGAVVASLDTLATLTGERRLEEISLALAPGASRARVIAAVRDELSRHPSLVILDRRAYRALAADFVLSFTNVFRGLAIAMFFIVLLTATLTLAASMSVRRRAFAMSEVCGLTARRLRLQLAVEALAIAALAWSIAVVLGTVLIPAVLRAMSSETGLLPPASVPQADLVLALPLAVAASLGLTAIVSRATVKASVLETLRFE